MADVVVTGLGIVSSIGIGLGPVETSLRELRHGLQRWDGFTELGVGPTVAAPVPGFDVSSTNPAAWSWPGGHDFDPAVVRSMAPHGIYALVALEEALAQSGLAHDQLGDGETGLACASVGSVRLLHHHLSRAETNGWHRYHPLGVVSAVAGTLNFNLGPLLGIRGVNCGYVSACTSSSHALGAAFDEIALGRQQRMLVDFLENHPGVPMSAERIAAHIRLRDKELSWRKAIENVKVVVCHIRRVMGADFIVHFRGQGYTLGEKQHGKARTQEESRSPTAERAAAAR